MLTFEFPIFFNLNLINLFYFNHSIYLCGITILTILISVGNKKVLGLSSVEES